MITDCSHADETPNTLGLGADSEAFGAVLVVEQNRSESLEADPEAARSRLGADFDKTRCRLGAEAAARLGADSEESGQARSRLGAYKRGSLSTDSWP